MKIVDSDKSLNIDWGTNDKNEFSHAYNAAQSVLEESSMQGSINAIIDSKPLYNLKMDN